MRKCLFILTLLLWSCIGANAQDTDPFSYNANIIPSTEAWKMSKYGNAMPSLYTGAMTFSVPLYTYKDEDFEIPLSLEYRYDGFRPSQPSGFVGLGWSLNCGGAITREIIGLPDDYIDSCIRGYYFMAVNGESSAVKSSLVHDSLSTQILLCQTSPVISEEILPNIFYGPSPLISSRPFPIGLSSMAFDGLCFDSASDVYHFSLPNGQSGSFVILPSGEIKVFDSTEGEGEYHITLDFNNSRNLNQTIIIETGDGYTYKFGANEYSIEYSSSPQWKEGQCSLSNNKYCFASLYLRSITAPNGRNVIFDRESGNPYFELIFSPGIHYRYLKLQDIENPENCGFLNFGEANYNTRDKFISTISHHLSSIEIDDIEIIKFHYGERSSLEYSASSFSPTYSNTSDLLPQIPGFIGMNPSVLNDRLLSVSIKDFSGTSVDSILFNHTYTSSSIHHSPKMFLRSVISNDGQFQFQYNNDSPSDLYPPVDCMETDHWGYWKGAGGTFTFNDTNFGSQDHDLYNLPSSNKDPDSTHTSYAALRIIQYPTGGATAIDYECNKAFQRINADIIDSLECGPHLVQCENYPAGGLRVKQISNTTGQYGFFSDTTRFDYQNSGLLYKMPRYSMRLFTGYINNIYGNYHTWGGLYVMDTYGSTSVNSQDNHSNHIEYPEVSIHFQDGSSVDYKYTNYRDYCDVFAPDTDTSLSNRYYSKCFVTVLENNYSPYSRPVQYLYEFVNYSPYYREQNAQLANIKTSDLSYLRGKPVEICNRDINGNILKITEYSYDTLIVASVKDVVNLYSHLSLVNRNYSRLRQNSVCITDYSNGDPLTTSTSYTYNELGQIVSEKTSYSSGRFDENTYLKYAHESDSTSLRCEITDAVKTKVADDEEYVIAMTHFNYGIEGLCKPTKLRSYSIANPYLKPSDTFSPGVRQWRETNFYYNNLYRPTRIQYHGGNYTDYSWDVSGRHLLSRTDNGTDNVTSYQWQDLVGLSEVIYPTGQSNSFTYDSHNRLNGVYDTYGNPLTCYDIHLVNGGDNLIGGTNFIRITTYFWPNAGYEDISYFDGLGYPALDISVGASSEGNIAVPYELDPMRRTDAKAFLPYVTTSEAFNPSALTSQQQWYQNRFGVTETSNYTQTAYETSPEGRPVSRRLPGTSYSNCRDTIVYRLNTVSDNIFDLRYIYSTTPAISSENSYIPSNSFKCTAVTDADGHLTETFTDPSGLIILERKYNGGSPADTYFVYDLKDSLVCIIQPEGSVRLSAGNIYGFDSTDEVIMEYSFLREYDGQGRIIRERQPGCGWTEYAYDPRGWMVFSRDAVMAQDGQWQYIQYDIYGNLQKKHLIQSAMTPQQMREAAIYAMGIDYDDICSLTQATDIALIEEHRYDYSGYGPGNPAPVPSILSFSPVQSQVSGVADIATNERGYSSKMHQYYEKLLVLPSNGSYSNPQYVERAFYYDNYGRLMQCVESNAQGGITRESWNYDKAEDPNIISHHVSVSAGNATKSVLQSFEYDARGRRINERTFIDGASTPVASVQFTYDVLGRQNASSDDGLVQANHYALQGWPRQRRAELNSSLFFDEYLRREDAVYGIPSHSGKITERFWMWNNQPMGTFEYSYDNLGRLTDSRIWMNGQPNSNFSERDINYDLNGNITSLKRYGHTNSMLIDNLTYDYSGNKISSINRQGYAYDYDYDANGNMTVDGWNRTAISYNILGLPSCIEIVSEGSAYNYSYLADGTKVAMTANDGSGYAYFGDIIFTRSASGNYSFESVPFAGGRIEGPNNIVRRYVTDHLGNVRAVVTDGQVAERSDYYPFGGRHANTSYPTLATNRWRLGAKETQTSLPGILVDFGARMYDPHTARWRNPDPLAWKYHGLSQYNYCGNDPVDFVDADGMRIIVSGSEEFIQKYNDMRKWLEQNDCDEQLIAIDNNPNVSITVQEGADSNMTPHSKIGNHLSSATINWNPNYFVLTNNRKVQLSPTIAFMHEIKHTLDAINNYSLFHSNTSTELSPLPKVEYDAILFETEIAQKLKEIPENTFSRTTYVIQYGRSTENLSAEEQSKLSQRYNSPQIPTIEDKCCKYLIARPQ